jgi:hypothetical protein
VSPTDEMLLRWANRTHPYLGPIERVEFTTDYNDRGCESCGYGMGAYVEIHLTVEGGSRHTITWDEYDGGLTGLIREILQEGVE